MLCWYCHWGWSKPVYDIYSQAIERLHGNSEPLDYGPSHIVWEDENWGDDSIAACLERFDDLKYDFSEEDLAVVRWSLEELAKVPLNQREIEPEDYDGLHPERYPPAEGVITIRV